ncbi:MAG: pantoate--beta-alanine ligase [Sulfurimonas sp.]
MRIFSDANELKNYLKTQTKTIGFVPTMGALHEGHLSLIKEAKKQNELVIVSIFVNPTQFLKGEDFTKYPRKDEADKKICEVAKVDILFMPQISDIYTKDEPSILAPKVRGYILEGGTRPSHFDGVLSIVMKLLNITSPTNAYFGKKDAQQLFLIKQMAKSFFITTNIIACETQRDKDALALSSRNVYLSKDEREIALAIPKSLRAASELVIKNQRDSKTIVGVMSEILSKTDISYIAIVDREFNPLDTIELGNSIILVEAKVGETRLLDNIWL